MDEPETGYLAEISKERLLPRLEARFAERRHAAPEQWDELAVRFERHWPRLFELLYGLYGGQWDLFFHLEQLLMAMCRSWFERSDALKELDRHREEHPRWFESQDMVGGVLYVDLFSENLAALPQYMEYFKDLGLTYLHVMPLFATPRGENDGGYAVSDYRSVNPDLGTMEELAAVAGILRREGISLVLDFVFNHTSDEHEWARRAQEGDPYFQSFYHIFPDRTVPDAYERTLRDIFPTVRRGSFTWHDGMRKWVWTTFNSYQWDLNYTNPAVFRAMAEEMLFLANVGVEVLRLDAVAFIWKRLGTDCENQPEAHRIIQAFNLVARIAAPSLLFKSEAIVHPDEVLRYIAPEECQLSYNPMLMALLWESLATRQVRLLEHAVIRRHRIPPGCQWANYLRCHDDIGWTFDDDDARRVGIDPKGHREFLNQFFTGEFPGSFARGVPFQLNPDTGDLRISGTLASLAGLEEALEKDDPDLIDMALRRITLLRAMVLSIGGLPLLYLGDEWGFLNDYSYALDPAKATDSRWVHRQRARWDVVQEWLEPERLERRLFSELVHLIRVRKQLPALAGAATEIVPSGNPHVLAFVRHAGGQRVVVLANFSDSAQTVAGNVLRLYGPGYRFRDHIRGADLEVSAREPLRLNPYDLFWLEAQGNGSRLSGRRAPGEQRAREDLQNGVSSPPGTR